MQQQQPGNTDLPGKGVKVALALGSGGARGYAHIGVIEVLEEQGYEITAVTGASMGALIGGLHAAGKLREYKDWVTGLDQFDLFRLLDLSLMSPGAIRADKVFTVLKDMIGDIRIEDLPIPYTAVATDLLAQQEVWFQRGILHHAIRASIAIPSVITPVMMQGRVLVDGGLLNPLPINPSIAAHADIIVAVNLSGSERAWQSMPSIDQWQGEGPSTPVPARAPVEEQSDEHQVLSDEDVDVSADEWMDRLKQRAARWFDWDKRDGGNGGEEPHSEEEALARAQARQASRHGVAGHEHARSLSLQELGLGKFEIMNLSIESMQQALTRFKLAANPPDVVIHFPKHVCKAFDFHKAPEIIQLGRLLAEDALEKHRHPPRPHAPF